MRTAVLLLMMVTCCLPMAAQQEWCVETQVSATAGDHTPLWLNANKHGLSSLSTSNGFLRAALLHPLRGDTSRISFGYGADVALAYGYTSTFIVQQAFAEVGWRQLRLSIGSRERPMELKNSRLSTGSQALGQNARPIPQVRAALDDYWTVPGLKHWLGFKGHLAYGVTTDDHWQRDFKADGTRYTEHTLYHSKAAYVKIGPKNIYYEMGLEMACQFGGRSYKPQPDGTMRLITSDSDLRAFWHALIPGGSSDQTDGHFRNAMGNHLGSWLARFTVDQPSWSANIYADQYFEDDSQFTHLSYDGYGTGEEKDVHKKNRYFLYDFRDWLLGVEVELKRCRYLSHVVAEFMHTKYQGGPVYHDHTAQLSEHICGRDSYYNHTLFTGWQHWGQPIGNPLYTAPLYNDDHNIKFYNNRFVAWHMGLDGQPIEGLQWRFLATWQRSYGIYTDPFPDPRENVSLLAEAEYSFSQASPLAGWSARCGVGLDRGELYGDNLGLQLTLMRSGIFARKGKRQ
jgi:hypothetical protein